NVHAEENNDHQAEEEHLLDDEFTNPFCAPTKDHPLEKVRRNPSRPVQTRRQLATDPEMCMFALTEELYQFDRLQVWELVDKPFGKTVTRLNWLWKNKKDEDQTASDYDNSDPIPQLQNVSSSADAHVPSQQELDLLFSPLYDEFFTATNIQTTSAPSTPTNVHAEENNDHQAEEEHLLDDEFTNPFCAPTKDHPLEKVRRNPSRPVQTRRQLATDPEMCMFALTVSTVESKNIKEAMADSA
nr:hypothetical protein [Tanacetum cinerariifolium]